ncbi:MAG: VacB/RNase II family 3'-5' exoribonuclease [Blastocatellia bacterium]
MKKKYKRKEAEATFEPDAVIAALREFPDGLSAKELSEYLNLNRAQQKQLTWILNRLQGAGLLRRYGNDFRWADSNRALIGTIRQRRRKIISFIPDDRAEAARGRIRIAPEEAAGTFDGDRVVISLFRHHRGDDREGKVELLLKRGTLRIVGRYQTTFRHHGFVESLDEKFPYEIDVEEFSDEVDPDELSEGSIVVIEVTRYPVAGTDPAGRVVQYLGASSAEQGIDIEIVIHKHDLPHIFPPEVLAETENISPEVTAEQRAGRLDLRDVPTVTIDGETARDFDDAISLKRLDNGNFHLGVHIADVSYYVREGTALDAEARLRGTSVYFPERAIPMLPENLSNGICSLNPKVDRLAMSALMEVNQHGKVVCCELRETVIRSNERMTYTNVNKLLRHEDPALSMRYADLLELFRTMEELARILIRMRERRGAIDFNLPESIFEFDDEGRIAGVLKAERNIAHRIIEEFMLLANETVAGHLERLGVPSVYRIHEEPEPQRVIEFAELARAYGYRFPVEGVSSHDYQRLSHQLAGKPEERVLAYAMLRSLQRARYTAFNAGHFGLAAPVYTHFTSPIRRYPDLLVHRILRALLQQSPQLGESSVFASLAESSDEESKKKKTAKGKGRIRTPIPASELEVMADESSQRERAADDAEREIDEWRKAVFMAERLGEEFDGMIVNVREFGFFVELGEFFIEGLVAVASLTDDYYDFNERTHTLTGRQRRKTYRLGDRVRVRVDRVNVDRHLVDFSVVTAPERGRRK